MSGRLAVTMCVGAGLLAAGQARAQSLRPNIMIIFDTSGSMRNNTGGSDQRFDGSLVCEAADASDAGRDGKTSRIFNLKKALREALQEVGTDEANFGLMRFPTLERALSVTCDSSNGYVGHYHVNNTSAVGGNNGCRLVSHGSNQTTYGGWYDSDFRQAVVVDVTRRPAALKPIAADFDPQGANLAEVYKWIDLGETTTAPLPVADPELRALSNTPLGRSLFYARMYFDNFVKPNDPKGGCRTNVVILATDGAETCDDTGGATFGPVAQASALLNTSGIRTYVLTDTSTGNANDQIAMAGGTAPAIRVDFTSSAAAKAALLGIIAATVPPPETCNGIDDNCNGLTDEGVSNKCAFDPTPARRHCAPEICDNGVDNDCDGLTDEGFPLNACGKPACPGAIPPETCNGLDDNCDGDIDEGFMTGVSCMGAGIGACKRFGILTCKADGTGTFCDVPPVMGTPEICNNIDDDCDGMTDEREGGVPLPGENEVCGVDVGACKSGRTVCRNGKLECESITLGGMEICNGIDDDCDGITDNGVFPGEGTTCLCPGLSAMQSMQGLCKPGTLKCRGMGGLVCEGCTLPSPELCDAKDNDCDGQTDFMAPCPGGFGCMGGACVPECRNSEFPCEAGFECKMGFCVPTRCNGVTCPDGHRCKDGVCVDPCGGVSCPLAGSRCIEGICENCYRLGCAGADELCIGGECKKDLCKNIACNSGEYCSGGACVALCTGIECPAGQTCAAGMCRDDACEGIACMPLQFCNPADGTCRTNPCKTKVCAPGLLCVPVTAECVPDPCASIKCDACSTCDVTADGIGQCIATRDCQPTRTSVRAGRGCGCGIGVGADDGAGESPGTGVALLLALAVAASWACARRRRRNAVHRR